MRFDNIPRTTANFDWHLTQVLPQNLRPRSVGLKESYNILPSTFSDGEFAYDVRVMCE
jgi:hypothetical protein